MAVKNVSSPVWDLFFPWTVTSPSLSRKTWKQKLGNATTFWYKKGAFIIFPYISKQRVILFLNIGSLNIHRINPKFNVDSKLADENMFHVYQGEITCDQNKFWVNMVEITTATTYILRIFDKVLLLLPNQSLRSFRNKQIEEFKRKHRGNSSKYPRKPTYPTFGKGKSTYKSPFNM